MIARNPAANKPIKRKRSFQAGVTVFGREMRGNWQLYIMALPAIALLFIFNYIPLGGLIIAFKNFKFDKGMFGSDWAEPLFYNFKILFTSEQALRSIRNTLLLNLLFIIAGVVCEVGLALLINEVSNKFFKRIVQSFTFLPFFISWIVVGVFAYNLLNYDYGAINNLLESIGLKKIAFYSIPGIWPMLLVIFARWKSTGYGSVIYLASLTGIDPTYYEAAQIDGANRWKQTWYISIPLLIPTITILTLLSIGQIARADFGMFYSIVGDAPRVYPTTDVIDTFVYRGIRQTGDYALSSATGFFQSILSFILIMGSNLIARRINREAALF